MLAVEPNQQSPDAPEEVDGRLVPVVAFRVQQGVDLPLVDRDRVGCRGANDVGSFDSLVSTDRATLVIGTAPGEWVTERERLRFGFEAEGLAIEPGPNPAGSENGEVGWFVDEPTYVFPEGAYSAGGADRMRTRLTAVLQRELGAWRIVHMHVSVGVPDEEVVEFQQRWSSA